MTKFKFRNRKNRILISVLDDIFIKVDDKNGNFLYSAISENAEEYIEDVTNVLNILNKNKTARNWFKKITNKIYFNDNSAKINYGK